MRSFFQELEQNLYDLINDSPISLDGKYFVVKDIFHSIEKAYESYLNLPEREEEQTIENNDNNIEKENDFQTSIETTTTEDGEINIKAEGKNIGDVISKAFDSMNQVNKEK